MATNFFFNQKITIVGEEVEKLVGGNGNWYSCYGKEHSCTLKILKIEGPYDPAILLLGIDPHH